MNGLAIFSHSFRQVSGNLGMAIKVSGWLVALVIILFAGLSQTGVLASLETNGANAGQGLLAGALIILAGVVFLFWGVSVVAIAWHRYILLEEIPRGVIPYRKEFHVGRYFWYGVGVSLLAVLAVAILSGILGMAVGPFYLESLQEPTGGASIGTFLLGLLVGTIVVVLYLRMALVLPAVALDEGLTIGQAWTLTSGHTAAIVTLALILAFINSVVPVVISVAMGGLPLMNAALSGLYQWFYFMLSISVLSTLYGHIVQKREVY